MLRNSPPAVVHYLTALPVIRLVAKSIFDTVKISAAGAAVLKCGHATGWRQTALIERIRRDPGAASATQADRGAGGIGRRRQTGS